MTESRKITDPDPPAFDLNDPTTHAGDFTEKAYEALLVGARAHYSFESFGTTSKEPHALWRHDVDLSVHRASRLAQIEAECDVRATYFLRLHSEFYNLLEREVLRLARSIATLGHDIGLHLDADFEDVAGGERLEEVARRERVILQDYLQCEVKAVSFHNPEFVGVLDRDDEEIAGMVSTYGQELRTNYQYISDSNGYWRFSRLSDVVLEQRPPGLHVLTHPEWWTPTAMSPRERVCRCLDGYRNAIIDRYDRALEAGGRLNVR